MYKVHYKQVQCFPCSEEELIEADDAEDDGDVPVAPAPAPFRPPVPLNPPVPHIPVVAAVPLVTVVAAVPAPHAPRLFYGPPRPPRPPRPPVPRVVRPAAVAVAGHAGGLGRGGGCGRGRRANPDAQFQTYENPDIGNTLPAFTPNRPPGIHFPRPLLRNSMTKAIDFFHLFFTGDMINDICSHTNSYAVGHISDGTHRSYAQPDGSWKDTTPEEINRLIALLIYFGLVKVSGVETYWSIKSLYNGLWAKGIMSRLRFKALMALLHVVDPAVETPGDKLRKVQSFVDDFKSKCVSLYQPRQQVAIDERMVKSRHRSGIRQYIKDKPTKWGIKLWVLADSSNGYTIDFNVYIGKAAEGAVSVNGLGYDVVIKLMRPLFNQGYHLYIDNFYTSAVLVKDLFRQGVATTGTIRENSRGFPPSLKNGSEWSKAGNVERGSMRWVRDPPILALQWFDNKVVSMLTTIENANDSIQVERKSKTGGVWRPIVVQQPQAIASYNCYMNAVDRSDQILATNNVLRKCMRWWKTLFFHLIDIAIVNSFILFREHQVQFPDVKELERPADYSLASYREELVRQICGFEEYQDPPKPSCTRPPTPTPPPPPGEFETVHIPVVHGDLRRNCVVCYKRDGSERRVNTSCSAPQCKGSFMHITTERNCFREFHSREYHEN